jgi:hypothetical protein
LVVGSDFSRELHVSAEESSRPTAIVFGEQGGLQGRIVLRAHPNPAGAGAVDPDSARAVATHAASGRTSISPIHRETGRIVGEALNAISRSGIGHIQRRSESDV